MIDMPTILWLADGPGWAYDQIYQNQSRALPAYEHEVFYMMRAESFRNDDFNLKIQTADIVVCMHLMYFVQTKTMRGEKVVGMLTGPRAWE